MHGKQHEIHFYMYIYIIYVPGPVGERMYGKHGVFVQIVGNSPQVALGHGPWAACRLIITYIWPLLLMGCTYHYCSMWCVYVYLIICVVNDEYSDSSTIQGFYDW